MLSGHGPFAPARALKTAPLFVVTGGHLQLGVAVVSVGQILGHVFQADVAAVDGVTHAAASGRTRPVLTAVRLDRFRRRDRKSR